MLWFHDDVELEAAIASEIPFVTESPILRGLITLKYAVLAVHPRADRTFSVTHVIYTALVSVS